MGYIPWYERIEQEKAEREGKKINKEVNPNKKFLIKNAEGKCILKSGI